MSVNLSNLPKPEAYAHMNEQDYQELAARSFAELELLSEEAMCYSDWPIWAASVIALMAADTQPKTIALPVETIEVLIELADMANYILPYRDPEKARMAVASAAYAYMRATNAWPLGLKTLNPPRDVEISDRVKI